MDIPNLKRIKISTEMELRTWISKNSVENESVMLVLHAKSSPEKYITREVIYGALTEYGWKSVMRYTLNANLIGHVISRM